MPTKRDEQRAFFRAMRHKLGLDIPEWLQETPEERAHRERQLPKGDRMEDADDAG